MKLNTDYVQLVLCMRCEFDFRDELNQINDPNDYERFDLSLNYFRSYLI